MEKLLGNLKQGLLFVLSAPAGTGKTTLVTKLIKEFACVVKSLSYTTRSPRTCERQGIDYQFVSKEEFRALIKQGEFLEFAHIYEDYYGTSKSWVRQQLQGGKHVVLVIDVQGAKQIKAKMDATFIFVKPPSKEELRNRLDKRQTETGAEIEERLARADQEMSESEHYDYCIINDCVATAYQVLRSLFIAEEHRLLNMRR